MMSPTKNRNEEVQIFFLIQTRRGTAASKGLNSYLSF